MFSWNGEWFQAELLNNCDFVKFNCDTIFNNSGKCKLKTCSRRFVTTTLTCECDETGCNWYSDTSRNSKILNEKGPKCIRQIKKGILEESCAKDGF